MINNINLQCDSLKKNIVGLINKSDLPISLVYYMMKDLMVELDSLNQAVVRREEEEYLNSLSAANSNVGESNDIEKVESEEELPE